MDKITYNLVYNRKKKLNSKGTALVQVETYLNGKKKYFSTHVYLRPDQWDKKRRIVKNHPNATALNKILYHFIAELEKKELALWQQGKQISLDLLKSTPSSEEANYSFLSFMEKELNRSSLKISTRLNHRRTWELLKEFKPVISFDDITYEFISSFDHFLRSKNYHTNTIAKHLKQLKRYVNLAINKEHLDIKRYAFRKFKIRSVENNHTYLLPEELENLENLLNKEKDTSLIHTLDAFLFCCYTGLRYSDFTSLSSNNIVSIGNNLWLVYKSVKTQINIRIPLYLLFQGKAITIISKYENNLKGFFQLKDNSNINKKLILLTKKAGINKRISFHTARHTNATLLIYNGVNITTVQKLLGHKNIRTTQVYASIMDETVIKDLKENLPVYP